MILKLILPYLSVNEVMKFWREKIIDDEDVSFFLSERFNILNGVHFKLCRKIIKTDCKATWDRIHNNEIVINKVLKNTFLSPNPRLKSRIYLGLKNNDSRLLKYYYEYYNTIDNESNVQFELSNCNLVKLLGMLPFELDGRSFSLGSCIVVKDISSNTLVGTIGYNGMVRIIQGNPDLVFLIRHMDTLIEIYKDVNGLCRKRKLEDNNVHRRPKIRRRLTVK